MTFAYLASPYSHPDEDVREARYLEALKATAWLLQNKIWVHSPIVHCHELAKLYRLPKDANFWMDYNFAVLERASELLILTIDGWQSSHGIRQEYDRSKIKGIPSWALTPGGNGTIFHKVSLNVPESYALASPSQLVRPRATRGPDKRGRARAYDRTPRSEKRNLHGPEAVRTPEADAGREPSAMGAGFTMSDIERDLCEQEASEDEHRED